MSKPLLLDLYCCQGGASAGYRAAGFDVVGVDLALQPRYPWLFVQRDVIYTLQRLCEDRGHIRIPSLGWRRPAAVHASPPCQAHTNAQRIQQREHPDLIAPTRELLDVIGLPYVIENVEGAPLKNSIMLCGTMFPPLRTRRHRLFESNVTLTALPHGIDPPQVKMGRPVREGDWYQAVGNFSGGPEDETGVGYVKRNMGVPWMSRDGVRECIPPVYAEYVGRQLMEAIR